MKWTKVLVVVGTMTVSLSRASGYESFVIEDRMTEIRKVITQQPHESLTDELITHRMFLAKRLLADIFTMRIDQLYQELEKNSDKWSDDLKMLRLLEARLDAKSHSPVGYLLFRDIESLRDKQPIDLSARRQHLESVVIAHTFTTVKALQGPLSSLLLGAMESPEDRGLIEMHLESLHARNFCPESLRPERERRDPSLSPARHLQNRLRELEATVEQRERGRLYAVQNILDLMLKNTPDHLSAASAFAKRLWGSDVFLNELRETALRPSLSKGVVRALCALQEVEESAEASDRALKSLLEESRIPEELERELKPLFRERTADFKAGTI